MKIFNSPSHPLPHIRSPPSHTPLAPFRLIRRPCSCTTLQGYPINTAYHTPLTCLSLILTPLSHTLSPPPTYPNLTNYRRRCPCATLQGHPGSYRAARTAHNSRRVRARARKTRTRARKTRTRARAGATGGNSYQ